MASPQDLLTALSRAFVLTETLSGDDPEIGEALEAAEEAHRTSGWLVIRLEGDGFSVNGESIGPPDDESVRFKEALSSARVTEIRLQEAVPTEVLLDFLTRLNPEAAEGGPAGAARFRGLEEAIGLSFQKGDQVPLGMAGSIQGLFAAEESPSEEPAEEVGGEGMEDEVGSEPSLPPELAELVESYLSAEGPEKTRLGEAVVAAAARLRESRDLGLVANLVEVLFEASDGGTRDPEALDLAVRLTTTGVASHLVGRLGSTRDEVDRGRLIRISRGLGREMAVALADALGEARDRYQRRSFMDAMVVHGDLAHEMAQGMVEDPRWYVVRNGVSLLGELGGEDSVSYLTSTLANEDARVRKETVLALSKLGGEDASMLILGMLDDPDTEVRAKACSAAGILRVEKAIKPLMALLEKDNNEDVQVHCLQALGRIGDPGVVPLIEKKAVGRLFSRPSKEVRLAAYKALGAIGTPHARGLLLKATKDSDLDVRRVALGFLE